MCAKILVVEDDPQLNLTYDILLKKEAHTVDHAFNGFEALDKVPSFMPEIILLDIRMPKMDGIEFLRKADMANKYPDIKIIVFSNMEQVDQLEEAMSLGAHKHVLKSSLSPGQLAQLINDTLSAK
jgi:CheY-like chemotaxis protein